MKRKALFLDRDGVINVEKHYLHTVEDFEFIDGVFEACRYFETQGYLIVVITNQAGIAKGYYTHEEFKILNDWMLGEFKKKSIDIARVYYCPHHPDIDGECICRKPNAGMIWEAQKEFAIDLAHSLLVGDKLSDMEAGKKARVGECYLISTGHDIRAVVYDKKIDNLRELVKHEKAKTL
ncbi:MAG: D,D-heptose 1,7-bisphosphate phosphatase [Sulfurovum sp. PC08-66]|jgi:D-glycero-D-manno-heptose 1,7-bisphosphate phosphatase|nr:MAG: D,D-heptose 1,7-bisphosphate phosphatase [Sulfurovum sp. PC08-66]